MVEHAYMNTFFLLLVQQKLIVIAWRRHESPRVALPVGSLLRSRDSATTAASICEVAAASTVGPMSGAELVPPPAVLSSSSSPTCRAGRIRDHLDPQCKEEEGQAIMPLASGAAD